MSTIRNGPVLTRTVCAYCKASGTLTREHLWPAALHSRLVAADEQSSNTFWLARLQKEIPNEPQIRDVCANCNNVILSKLDAYICCLFDNTLVHIREQHERVHFEYDYHLLKRWLLKLCFNSGRIHSSRDLFALDAVLPYIMGKSDIIGKSVQLFLQLSFPEIIPEEDIHVNVPPERPIICRPTMNRVGHSLFRVPGVGEKLLRTVHLRSFTFYLAFFKPNEKRGVSDDFADCFSRYTRAVLLRPSQPKIELVCNGIGAWTSVKNSRSNKLVFDIDG